MLPSPLVSEILAALVNTIDDDMVDNIVTVASFGVLVLGSSLVSVTVLFVPCAVTVAVLDTPPAFIA